MPHGPTLLSKIPPRINRNRISVTGRNPALTWKGEGAQKRVLGVVFTGYTGYDSLVGQTTTLSRDVWVTMVPELKDFCATHAISPADLDLRLEQLIGLNPGGGRTRLAEIWASPEDLFRPSPDPEITDHEAELDFRPPGPFSLVNEEHVRWINDLKAVSYGESGMPWTRLGYTYDWGNSETIVGLSEFVIRKGATVEIASVTSPADYCRADRLTQPVVTFAAVVNSASATGGMISPGEVVTISGQRLGPETPSLPGGWHEDLAGTRVFFSEHSATLVYASDSRLIVNVPESVKGLNTVLLSVDYNGRRSAAVPMPVGRTTPGIFTARGATGAAVVVNSDGTLNDNEHPASRGSVAALWATGLGVARPTNSPHPRPEPVIRLTVGGASVPPDGILFAGYTYPGIAQINFRVPDTVPPDDWAEITLTSDYEVSRRGVFMRIQ